MEDNDKLWKDYEILEKMTGEHLAEKVLPEFSDKHMHANAIYRERRRVSSKIELDRLAVPPSNSMQELQQLSAWNKWIRYIHYTFISHSHRTHAPFIGVHYNLCIALYALQSQLFSLT